MIFIFLTNTYFSLQRIKIVQNRIIARRTQAKTRLFGQKKTKGN